MYLVSVEAKVMKFKKVMGTLFPVVDSDRRKDMVVKQILGTPQENKGAINIHRHDPNNVGDFYCAPYRYFEVLKNNVLDINGIRKIGKQERQDWAKTVSENSLIIGGGGLLNLRHFELQMKLFEQLKRLGKKTVLWGPGHNDTDTGKFGKRVSYNVDLKNFGLVGVRDYSYKQHWVPCVSCLHPIFDQPFTETQEIGILFGKKSSQNEVLQKRLESYPTSNNTTNLEEMVAFIGTSQTIVTDSYHAMYWGMLLGKKILAVPTTTKFYDFKYPAYITSYDAFEADLLKAPSYSGVLEECREINHTFAEKVFDYLNL